MQTKLTAPRSHIPIASMTAFLSLSCWARAGLVYIDCLGLSRGMASGPVAWAIALKTLPCNVAAVPLLAVPTGPRTWESFSLWWDTPGLLHCVSVCPGWSLGPWLSVLTRRLMCCQAKIPCQSEPRDLTVFSPEISSDLLSAWIQPGGSMKVLTVYRFVFQWHWWSSVARSSAQTQSLANWWLWNFQRRQGRKKQKGKKPLSLVLQL